MLDYPNYSAANCDYHPLCVSSVGPFKTSVAKRVYLDQTAIWVHMVCSMPKLVLDISIYMQQTTSTNIFRCIVFLEGEGLIAYNKWNNVKYEKI